MESLLPLRYRAIGVIVAEASLKQRLRAIVSKALLRLIRGRDKLEERQELSAELVEVFIDRLWLAKSSLAHVECLNLVLRVVEKLLER